MKKLLVVALAALAFSACKKDPTPAPVPIADGSFALLDQKILAKSCGLSGCHASASDAGFGQHDLLLKGDRDAIFQALVERGPKNQAAIAAGFSQIKPSDPSRSFFFEKLRLGQNSAQFGNEMPLGLPALTAGQIEFVRQWIAAGAPRTGHVADQKLLE